MVANSRPGAGGKAASMGCNQRTETCAATRRSGFGRRLQLHLPPTARGRSMLGRRLGSGFFRPLGAAQSVTSTTLLQFSPLVNRLCSLTGSFVAIKKARCRHGLAACSIHLHARPNRTEPFSCADQCAKTRPRPPRACCHLVVGCSWDPTTAATPGDVRLHWS